MRVHLSLGSNLGDRAGHLEAALVALDALEGVDVMACSRCYETEPMGGIHQPAFLNMAAEIETDKTPLELLNAVKEIEARLGRKPTYRWGPRVIDIDLILWGPKSVSAEHLDLPHPGFRERYFVLAPLAEIAPDAVDPVTGKTVAQLASDVPSDGLIQMLPPITP